MKNSNLHRLMASLAVGAVSVSAILFATLFGLPQPAEGPRPVVSRAASGSQPAAAGNTGSADVVTLGADPLGNTPCSAIVQAAVDNLSVGVLYFPPNPLRPDGTPGFYWFNKAITITRTLRIEGLGTGSLGGSTHDPVARIWCDYGVGVFILPGPNDTPGGFTANGCYISHLSLKGLGRVAGAPVKVAHGIESHVQVHLRDIRCETFSGCGVYLNSSDGGTVSRSTTDNIWLVSNGSHGFSVQGNDANACEFRSVQASNNGGFGIWEASFLGNYYYSPSCEGNFSGDYHTDANVNGSAFYSPYCEGSFMPSEFGGPTALFWPDFGAPITGTPNVFSNGFSSWRMRPFEDPKAPAAIEVTGRPGQDSRDLITIRNPDTYRVFGVKGTGEFGNGGDLGADLPVLWNAVTRDWGDGKPIQSYAVFGSADPAGSWTPAAFYGRRDSFIIGQPVWDGAHWKLKDVLRVKNGTLGIFDGKNWRSVVLGPPQ